MDNTCVACGNPMELPEDTQLCQKCQKEAGAYCPSCNSVLEVMNISKYLTVDGFGYSTLFHCNTCHNDWEKEAEYVAKPVQFKRKFWG